MTEESPFWSDAIHLYRNKLNLHPLAYFVSNNI
jgi:hypothetical protein